jgi:predicted AlkP superfamily pyrophosphatase or phosphodiesterase
MPDQYAETLSRIESHHLPGLELGDGHVHPHYGGYSILNVPASICGWLGAPQLGAAPLDERITKSLAEEYQNVILILMDALSLKSFSRWVEAGLVPAWSDLLKQGIFNPLTSILPSTTAAALTSLWTGSSAAEHGIVGYEMWLKEYGMVINSILYSPMSFKGETGSLARTGFDPETFIKPGLLGTHLSNHGIQAYAFQHHSISGSGLSRMILQDVNRQPFRTQSDLWVNLRRVLEENPDQRKYIWLYWGEVDYMSHNYGPDDERTISEFSRFSATLDNLFLGRLSPAARIDTLLILLADHGQIKSRPNPHYDLSNHPNLVSRLHIMPTGENRLMSLFPRPGQSEAVREYIERTWPHQFLFLEPSFAVECGLFGPGELHPRLFDRLGDLIVIARGQSYLWWSPKADHLLGRHGGLSADEMLVPFLAAEL